MNDTTISLQQDVKDLLKYYGKHEATRSDVVIFTETDWNDFDSELKRVLDGIETLISEYEDLEKEHEETQNKLDEAEGKLAA